MKRLSLLVACLAGICPSASASWLDSDFYCRVFGCVVVHDGVSFDVYDNFNLLAGVAVLPGGRMIPSSANPIQGFGPVNPVITGSITEGFHNVPLQDQSVVLGIDQTGNSEIDFGPSAGPDGFLDASGAFQSFELTEQTDLVAADTSAQRSFYISSTTDFRLSAQAFVIGTDSAFNAPNRLDEIDFSFGLTRQGNDAGMAFGSNARNGNHFRKTNGIDTVGDLYGTPTSIYEFRRSIRRRASSNLPSQSIRFDYVYGFEDYDMSLGTGHLRYRIEFDFYNR